MAEIRSVPEVREADSKRYYAGVLIEIYGPDAEWIAKCREEVEDSAAEVTSRMVKWRRSKETNTLFTTKVTSVREGTPEDLIP